MRLALPLLLALVACGTGPTWQRVHGPDGSPNWYAITCRHRQDCYEVAGRACPHGYSVADQDSKSEWSAGAGGGVAFAGSKRTDTYLVRCAGD